jgi:hydrogenase maturation protein HypF
MKTWHLHIKGIVQGVGFRPFVYQLATQLGLKGWVNNGVDGVHIKFNASEKRANEFEQLVTQNAPVLARITAQMLTQTEPESFDTFQIIHSQTEGEANLLLTPDFAICPDCAAELSDPQNRRYRYPFITCTNCGPRFSITHRLPYDRPHTKMDAFLMCQTCQEEYDNPLNRRYFSQTNSCPDCRIELTLYGANQTIISKQDELILSKIPQLWNEGNIVAIKGIGGYLLTCDAGNEEAVARLRKRKHRPTKPFAVMFPDIRLLESYRLPDATLEELRGSVSPIVLLKANFENLIAESVAPGLDQLGVMLPYTPLYALLLKAFEKPIVATSGNISNSPIVFQDELALAGLTEIADYILANNREIVIPQDDSVIKFSPFNSHKIILRRSRGLAPSYINAGLSLPDQGILATGAMLKSTFGLLHQGNAYLSQYLGDLAHFDTIQNYRHTIDHFVELFKAKPEVILHDKHPDYPSTRYSLDLARELNIPAESIQHHQAHFGAVLGENQQIDTTEPILGVIWDGTGLGDDEQIWGGEFFVYEDYAFSRRGHFTYFPSILGDKMALEPRISAFASCWGIDEADSLLRNKFSNTEWKVYQQIMARKNPLQTSSVGRLFDAVASLLGLMDMQSYEGEAALALEQLGTDYCQENGFYFPVFKIKEALVDGNISTQAILREIISDIQAEKSKAFIAAKFHFILAAQIKAFARRLGIYKIAFSGGVFQNGLLVDMLRHLFKTDYELFFHQQLSPNDENIAFGQIICYQINQQKASSNQEKSQDYVFSDSR